MHYAKILHLLSFLNKMKPVFVIHNNTIATADDIITLSDVVNIFPVELSRAIITLSYALNWLEKCNYFRPKYFSICCQTFWELGPLSVYIRLHFINCVAYCRVRLCT